MLLRAKLSSMTSVLHPGSVWAQFCTEVPATRQRIKRENRTSFFPHTKIPLKDSQVFITVIRAGALEGANFKAKIKRETLTMGRLAEQKAEGEDVFMSSLPVS